MKPRDEALVRAVAAAGGATVLSKQLGVSKQAVVQWRECPALRVLAVERASGVPRHELRPDLYPAPAAPPPAPRRRQGKQEAAQ